MGLPTHVVIMSCPPPLLTSLELSEEEQLVSPMVVSWKLDWLIE